MEERDRGEEADDEGEEHDQGRYTLPLGNIKVLVKMVLVMIVMVMRGKNTTKADIHFHLATSRFS